MAKKLAWVLGIVALVVGSAAMAHARPGRAVHSHRASKKAVMHLAYQRSGGFAGFNDHVEVDGDQVTVTRRGKVTLQRQLSKDEQKHLAALAHAAEQAEAKPEAPHRPMPDAFNLSVSANGKRVDIAAPPSHLPEAWQKLAEALSQFVNEPQTGVTR